ncbi:PH domain-containing protein [Williamsia herbipolensis]|uniref:PH domain-containing protein n=1 Tax=Williamsia herbipolensis TaxID=1603258 RepID=A0AAU4JXH0_9NOCA|nr:PH domain-containing protein [Williamsia herbipolensis]
MDNSSSWATPVPVGCALTVGGVVLLAAAALSGSDPAGLVIMGVAGLLLVALGASSLLIRPRLSATRESLTIRTVTGRRTHPRESIARIRVVSYPRFGRRVPNLEIDIVDGTEADGDERLVILGRWELGAAPADVAEALADLGHDVTDSKDLRYRTGDPEDS